MHFLCIFWYRKSWFCNSFSLNFQREKLKRNKMFFGHFHYLFFARKYFSLRCVTGGIPLSSILSCWVELVALWSLLSSPPPILLLWAHLGSAEFCSRSTLIMASLTFCSRASSISLWIYMDLWIMFSSTGWE